MAVAAGTITPGQAASLSHTASAGLETRATYVSLPSRAGPLVDLNAGSAGIGGEIRRAPDGLFYLNATVNGVPVRFLVDTGASTVVLTRADAERAGVLPSEESFSHRADTAAGQTTMARVTLARLTAGPSEQSDVDAVIASAGLGVSLLGQSWLSQLESVTIAGDRMMLQATR